MVLSLTSAVITSTLIPPEPGTHRPFICRLLLICMHDTVGILYEMFKLFMVTILYCIKMMNSIFFFI